MRVALVGPVFPYRGGIAHYTTALAQALRELGHELLIVSFRRQYPSWLYPGRSDKDPSQSAFQIEDPHYSIDSLNPLTWLVTHRKIRAFQPDLIILQWWTSFFAPVWFTLALLNKLFQTCPLVFICHNVFPHEKGRWDLHAARVVLRFADHVITQSEAEADRLRSILPRVSHSVVPHPVYDIFRTASLSAAASRDKLNLPREELILLFFGIVRAYKGLHELLLAMVQVKETWPTVKLLVVGEFWEDRKSYQQMIRKLALDEHVIVEDRYVPNEEVALYFTAADMLVAPYRQHTGSGVVQLSIGFDLPVVTIPEWLGGADSVDGGQNDATKVQIHKNGEVRHEMHWRLSPPELQARATALARAIKGCAAQIRHTSQEPPRSPKANKEVRVTTWHDLAGSVIQRTHEQ